MGATPPRTHDGGDHWHPGDLYFIRWLGSIYDPPRRRKSHYCCRPPGRAGRVGEGPPPPVGKQRADLAASFQQAVVDVLVEKSHQALRKTGLSRLAVGGGVAANGCLREALLAMAAAENVEVFIPPLSLCTDNAAMAAMAVEKWRLGQFASLDLDAIASGKSARAK